MLEKSEISAVLAAEIWGSSLFNSIAFHTYAPIICKGNFEQESFVLNLGLKDMRLLQNCADQGCVPMPFLADIHEKLLVSLNLGREKFDWSAIALLTRERAGLNFKN